MNTIRNTIRPFFSANKQKSLAQAGIETTVALVAIFMILLGATQFFIWVNRTIVQRHRAYNNSRILIGYAPGVPYRPSEFQIFPESLRRERDNESR